MYHFNEERFSDDAGNFAVSVDVVELSWGRFHQHFTSSFCANILAPKNYKAKLQAQKVFGARILAQKLLVKC